MAKTISIRPQELRRQAAELEKLRQQHLSIMKELRVLVMSLSDDWKGEAQEAFVRSFLAKSKTMSALDSTLAKYIAVTYKAADEAEAADRLLKAKIQSMKS